MGVGNMELSSTLMIESSLIVVGKKIKLDWGDLTRKWESES
jgi:hypothetical protein